MEVSRIAHYRVLEKLGQGGMGVVYKARDERLERIVAVKVLPAGCDADPERRRRFAREARAASALNHPNIITVHDAGEHDGSSYLVMEWVEGETLGRVVAAGLEPRRAVRIAIQMADALAAAHTAGIVHRDLKPANVMVTKAGLVKILDFGLAKWAGPPSPESEETRTLEPQTVEGTTVGTCAYMAPEQAEGQAVDARADLFSFGAVLYEMLAGRRAFTGATNLATLAAVLHEEPAPLPPDTPGELQRIVARCLRKKPAERYAAASDLKTALDEALRALDLPTLPSIAVLPFANLSADKENEYFSDGLTEDVIDLLAQQPGLRVTARTSSFALRGKDLDVQEIGARLKVAHLVEGSVRRAGNRIRVTAQLVKVSDGYHLWSQHFDRELADVFAIQDEIAGAIVEKLKVHLSADRPVARRRAPNIEAYQYVLRARQSAYRFTRESIEKGLQYYQKALDLDEDYADAYAGMAETHWAMAFWGFEEPRHAAVEAKRLLKEAIRRDDRLAEAHSTLGAILALFDFEWEAAEREMARARELNPSSPVVLWHSAYVVQQATGRLDEAEALMQRAIELDPLSPLLHSTSSVIYGFRHDFDRAIRHLRQTIELDPNYWHAHYVLGLMYGRSKRAREAAASLQWADELSGGNPFARGALAWAHIVAGQEREGRTILTQITAADVPYKPPYSILMPLIALGETETALDCLERAVDARDPCLISVLKNSPLFDPLRSHPRFQTQLRRAGLA